jgi:YbbR domain-containing protein
VNRFDDRNLKAIRIKVDADQKKVIAFQPDMIRLPRGLRVVAISPPSAQIHVQQLVERKVPVTPRVVGEVSKGYALKGSPKVAPTTVLLRGPKGSLEQLARGGLALAELDLTNAEGTVKRTLSVVSPLPEHVEALTSLKVKVSQDVVALRGEMALSEVALVTFGFKEPNYTPVLELSSVGVWLKGPLPVMNKLDPKNLSLMLDLTKITKRTLMQTASVVVQVGPDEVKGLPPGVTATKVVPPRITVKFIKKDQNVAPPP